MNLPPIVLQIINLLQLAISAGPAAEKLYQQAHDLFNKLFAGGWITIEQQAALHSWADAHEAATLAGNIPPEFTVEANPS